jgi:hypothetical protein
MGFCGDDETVGSMSMDEKLLNAQSNWLMSQLFCHSLLLLHAVA